MQGSGAGAAGIGDLAGKMNDRECIDPRLVMP
jgi:hypothetical protein